MRNSPEDSHPKPGDFWTRGNPGGTETKEGPRSDLYKQESKYRPKSITPSFTLIPKKTERKKKGGKKGGEESLRLFPSNLSIYGEMVFVILRGT